MGLYPVQDIGAHVVYESNPKPTNDAGSGAVNGTGIDLTTIGNPKSCVLYAAGGAASGTPTTQTLDAKLQDSADNSTFADLSGAAITQITADSTEGIVDVNLSSARRYVRVVRTVAFTGGTSPAWPVDSGIVFGGSDTIPQSG